MSQKGLPPLLLSCLSLLSIVEATLLYEWSVCESNRLFLYDFELRDDGCRIICVYLNSSSDLMHHKKFLDYSFTKNYELNDSEECKKSKLSQVCVQILTAAFKSPQNTPVSYNITFNGKSHIADPETSDFNHASYKQEFCFPTDDLMADHEIKISPVSRNQYPVPIIPRAGFDIPAKKANETDLIETRDMLPGSSHDPNMPEGRRPKPGRSGAKDGPEPGSAYDAHIPRGGRPQPGRAGAEEDILSVSSYDFEIPRTAIEKKNNETDRAGERDIVTYSSFDISNVPRKSEIIPDIAFAPPLAEPVEDEVVIRTKSLLERSENGTITRHEVGSAQLDIMVTFKNKKKN